MAPGPVAFPGLTIFCFPIGVIALNGGTINGFSSRLPTCSFDKLRGQSINHNSFQINNFYTYPLDQRPNPPGCYQPQPYSYLQSHPFGFNLFTDAKFCFLGPSSRHHQTDAIYRKFSSHRNFRNPGCSLDQPLICRSDL